MSEYRNSPKKAKEPWPTKEAMEQIYAMKLWGGSDVDFYSGIGSHHPEIVDPYIGVVTSFLRSFKDPLVVCDLGCGDFNVGKELAEHTQKYVAVDIVPELIERNKKKFTNDKIEFHCLDVAADDLPPGDCAIVRQVLQHLSNAEIQRIVPKLTGFRYLIVTEHIPEGEFKANADIISGQGIRLKKQSGVDLLAPPFNLKVKEHKKLHLVKPADFDGLISTTLYITA
ncbi:MAG: class I SAM-dependent methyltransferase [Balneolaceae bacterium]|nr:MAG: class I SAM-dependent methyltransferase [Balneolaceae bacterium]